MRTNLQFAVLGALGAALPGCIEPPEPTAFQSLATPGMQENGRFLLGVTLDDLPGRIPGEHFTVSTRGEDAAGNPVTVSIASAALLKSTGALTGVVLTGGTFQLRLTVVEQTATRTKVRLEGNPGTGWGQGPCGSGLAVALAGSFTRAGKHISSASRLTFACVDDGAAGKCIEWGFPPGTSDAKRIWKQHQACTRMVRADSCSDGVSHTRSGTRLWFFDADSGNDIPDARTELEIDPVETWPPPPDRYFFEAIWREDDLRAACLSKVRWQSLEPGALCGGTLPDPRVDLADSCEATSIADAIVNGGAILFNKSQYSDLALGLWHGVLPNGQTDYVTTVRGYHGGVRLPTVAPFQAVLPPITYTYDRIDALLLRVPPVGLTTSDYAAVVTFKNTVTGSRVLARRGDPRFTAALDYAEEFDEGFVLERPRPGAEAAVILYRNPASDDYVSSAVGPPNPSYVALPINPIVGYLPAPESRW